MHTPDPTAAAVSAIADTPVPGPASAGRYEVARTAHGFTVLDHATGQFATVVDTAAAASTPAAGPGLGAGERRLLVITASGATLLLAGGGAVLMAGHGIAVARPALHDLSAVLMWAAILVGLVVFGVAVLLGRRAVRGARVTVHEEHHYHTQARGLFSRATTNVRE